MGSEQQVVRMDTVRDLSSALWSLRTSQEAARLLRTPSPFSDASSFLTSATSSVASPSSRWPSRTKLTTRRTGWSLLEDFSHFLEASRQCVTAWPVTGSVPGAERFCCRGSIFPPRPCFSFPPPCPGVLRAPPEAEVGAPVPVPGHLLPLLLLAPHPQAVSGHGLPSPGAGRRRRRVCGARLPQTCHCPLAPW